MNECVTIQKRLLFIITIVMDNGYIITPNYNISLFTQYIT